MKLGNRNCLLSLFILNHKKLNGLKSASQGECLPDVHLNMSGGAKERSGILSFPCVPSCCLPPGSGGANSDLGGDSAGPVCARHNTSLSRPLLPQFPAQPFPWDCTSGMVWPRVKSVH